MIRRQLAQIVLNPPELRAMPFMDLMRTAADAGLIRDARPFHAYREKRNIISHTYDEKRAEEVLTVIAPFVEDMRFLLAELKRRNP
jgi:nucleotidyltransferase substrate binding protein (TIGR01987 family)